MTPRTRGAGLAALAAIVVLAAALGAPGVTRAATFSDTAGSPFAAEIEWLASQGVTDGCGGGRFCPRAAVTRAEMASFLARMFDYTATPANDPFSDDDGSMHEDDINRLAAAGITAGCAPGRFCPSAHVDRAEMASFLARALNLTFGAGSDHFADDDASVHEWNLDRIFYAGIGGACGAERSCPTQPVTREQMAAFLWRTVFGEPIGPAGVAELVSHDPSLVIAFDGPARWRGVTFSADGTTALVAQQYGSIPDRAGSADQTALVNGVRYAHLADGPMAGTWVKVDATLTLARGRAPAPPACAYLDLPTSRQSYDEWATTLLDTIYLLPASYAPGDRVDTGGLGLNGGYTVRSLVASQLASMASAARAAGAPLGVVSAYRSHAQQAATFQHWVAIGGYEKALRTSARPGHSEHQLGTTIDFTSAGGAAPWQMADWAATPAGAWMAANAWQYGFVMSYPRGSFSRTCYDYEPWHYRFVGLEIAAELRAEGVTLREAIWAAHGP